MSAIAVGERRYAAGLYWLERGGAGATARAARRLGRPWCVHHGERTGFAAEDGSREGAGPEGLPALALALQAHLQEQFWMALVEGDEPGGGGRFALVKARGGAVLADGDEVFDDRAAALEAFERARGLGWTLHATPGVRAGLDASGPGIAVLEPAALADAAAEAGRAIALWRAVPAGRPGRRLSAAVLGLAVLAGIAGTWAGRDALLHWLAGPEPAPATLAPPFELSVSVDGAALAAACRRALIENPPFLPAWRIERMDCAARFADAELAALRPELAGRPVLLVRWRLGSGRAEAMHRRLAEAHLARWHAAQVTEGRAWAAAPLAPVLRAGGAEASSFLDLRRAVDRAFGAGGAQIGYARGTQGSWAVRIEDPRPLSRLGPLVGGIAGLEIVGLARGAEGGWRLEGRPVAPERLTASELRALGVRVEDPRGAGDAIRAPRDGTPGTAPGLQPEREEEDGTQGHDDA